MGGQTDPLEIVQEISVWPYEQMVYAQNTIGPEDWHTQTPLGFDIQTDHLISARRPDLLIINNERACKIVDLTVPANRVTLKETEKKDKYLGLARELKKLTNMKATIIPIVISTLGTVTEDY